MLLYSYMNKTCLAPRLNRNFRMETSDLYELVCFFPPEGKMFVCKSFKSSQSLGWN